MVDFINQGWVGIAIGIVVSIYFYRKAERLPEPRVTFISDHALTWDKKDKLPSGVEIRYDGIPVQRISRSLVRIWNAGNGCLTKDLVPAHDRVRFHLPTGGKFLRANILKENNPSSLCDVTIDPQNPSEAFITFDYLNKNDGMVVGLLHTDPSPTPELKGSVKGYQFKITEEPPRKPLKGHRKWISPLIQIWMPLLLGVISIGLGVIPENSWDQIRTWLDSSEQTCPKNELTLSFRAFTVGMGISYLVLGIRVYWVQRRTYPKTLGINRTSQTTPTSSSELNGPQS